MIAIQTLTDTGGLIANAFAKAAQTGITTVRPPDSVITGNTAVGTGPARGALASRGRQAAALAIRWITPSTIFTGTRNRAITAPGTLWTKLFTKPTSPTTHTGAKTCFSVTSCAILTLAFVITIHPIVSPWARKMTENPCPPSLGAVTGAILS